MTWIFAIKGAQALAHTNWDPSPMYERKIFLFLGSLDLSKTLEMVFSEFK